MDTQGPKVTSAVLDPRLGRVTITLADGLSGLGAGVLQASSYVLQAPNGRSLPVSGLSVSPLRPNTLQTVTLNFAAGRGLGRGRYVLTIAAGGVADNAGNSLDERFFVPFPGLYNQPGQNYIAAFNVNGGSRALPAQFVPYAEVVAARNHARLIRRLRRN